MIDEKIERKGEKKMLKAINVYMWREKNMGKNRMPITYVTSQGEQNKQT